MSEKIDFSNLTPEQVIVAKSILADAEKHNIDPNYALTSIYKKNQFSEGLPPYPGEDANIADKLLWRKQFTPPPVPVKEQKIDPTDAMLGTGAGAALGAGVGLSKAGLNVAKEFLANRDQNIAKMTAELMASKDPNMLAAQAASNAPTTRATGKGSGLINWANSQSPLLTELETLQQGNTKQAWKQILEAQKTADLTKGFDPTKTFLLPKQMAESTNVATTQKALSTDALKSIAQTPLRMIARSMPVVGGAAAGYDIANAIDQYTKGNVSDAAAHGLSGSGALATMFGLPITGTVAMGTADAKQQADLLAAELAKNRETTPKPSPMDLFMQLMRSKTSTPWMN
jgi:hypothetical protein